MEQFSRWRSNYNDDMQARFPFPRKPRRRYGFLRLSSFRMNATERGFTDTRLPRTGFSLLNDPGKNL
jgi:hypothetical protein